MASGCYGRRLSELLQEQQEPFLPVAGAGPFGQKGADVGRRRRRSALGGALRRALRRWDVTGITGFTAVAGCFLPCGAAGGLDRFRQLRRAHDDYCDCDDDGGGGGGARRLSPVSVLDVLHADEDSNWEDEDRPSTSSVSSQPSDSDLDLAGFTRLYTAAAKIRATEAPHDEAEKTMPPTTTSGNKSMMDEKEVEQRTTVSSSWESVAADIARIPLLLELDLSGGLAQERRRQRRRLGDEEAEEEAWCVVARIEAMIFEEMRGDAVRDMID